MLDLDSEALGFRVASVFYAPVAPDCSMRFRHAAEFVAAGVRDARSVEIAGAGHRVYVEAPDQFNAEPFSKLTVRILYLASPPGTLTAGS